MSVTLDSLFALAEAGPLLDKVETALRGGGRVELADSLLKLQQDVGVQIDREMSGYDPAEPSPGPETARLNAAYQPVTEERIGAVLNGVANALLSTITPDDINGLKSLMETLGIPLAAKEKTIKPVAVKRVQP